LPFLYQDAETPTVPPVENLGACPDCIEGAK